MLKSRPAKEAKAMQCACRGEAHLNAPHSMLPWTARNSSPSAHPCPETAETGLTHTLKKQICCFHSSPATHILKILINEQVINFLQEPLTVRQSYCTCTSPVVVGEVLLGQIMIFCIQEPTGVGSLSQACFSDLEGEGLIKWLGLSLKLHPALSSTLLQPEV